MTEPRHACPTEKCLSEFLAGHLTSERTDEVAEHLESCHACQQRLERLDVGEASVDQLVLATEPIPFTEESHCRRVVERIDGQTQLDPPSKPLGRAGSAHSPGTLGDYDLLEPIGEGGMGTVYRSRHANLGTPAAVKILQPHRQADQITIERFEREMVALGQLDHPNIVRALDAGEEGGRHYLVMEFVDGCDLGRISKLHGRLSVADACEVVRQAAKGLDYIHHHGRVHRDVKPSNLILSEDGAVKILDLGLARVEEYPLQETISDADDILGGSTVDLTRTHQIMGTLEYMSPEQVRDSRTVDQRADIYSLGCTLYKLLVGHSPFASSKSITALSQLLEHVQAPAPPIRASAMRSRRP